MFIVSSSGHIRYGRPPSSTVAYSMKRCFVFSAFCSNFYALLGAMCCCCAAFCQLMPPLWVSSNSSTFFSSGISIPFLPPLYLVFPVFARPLRKLCHFRWQIRVCTPHCRAQKIKRFHTVQGLVRGAAAYGSPSLIRFLCGIYSVRLCSQNTLTFFFFFVIVHQLLRHKPSACTRIDCVSASCAGGGESSPGQKGLPQLCKLSGLLSLLCKLVCRCVTQYEQNQRMAGILFLPLVHIKKYMVRVSSQKCK